MGFMDKVKGKMGRHGDKVDRTVERTSETADAKTGGRHRRHIRMGTGKVRERTGRMSRGRHGKGGGSAS
ncbi:antitoxin, partial [Streptomyces megasporus]|uniref:antitoxin n=1 Tax=Streptomyces megasporus TaxID=44060 RepID=UPI0004E17DFE